VKITELFHSKKRVLSFELSAPRDGNLEGLFHIVAELKRLGPDYVSVTYGAGGSSRDMTFGIAVRLKQEGLLPLMHFTCVGHSRLQIKQLLDLVRKEGIENILALRGDPPRGQAAFSPAPDGFRYADELIRFIRAEGYDFCLGVAGYPESHPESGGWEKDLENLKRKVLAGGQFIVTQMFFDNRDYFRYVDRVRGEGLSFPIQPGIWLLTDYAQTQRITALCGARIPAEVRAALDPIQNDPEACFRYAVDYATAQCVGLLEGGAPGVHFYVLNKNRAVQAVLENLKKAGFSFS
jgi:methylenetetrahydrofolate reductase (NADH)